MNTEPSGDNSELDQAADNLSKVVQEHITHEKAHPVRTRFDKFKRFLGDHRLSLVSTLLLGGSAAMGYQELKDEQRPGEIRSVEPGAYNPILRANTKNRPTSTSTPPPNMTYVLDEQMDPRGILSALVDERMASEVPIGGALESINTEDQVQIDIPADVSTENNEGVLELPDVSDGTPSSKDAVPTEISQDEIEAETATEIPTTDPSELPADETPTSEPSEEPSATSTTASETQEPETQEPETPTLTPTPTRGPIPIPEGFNPELNSFQINELFSKAGIALIDSEFNGSDREKRRVAMENIAVAINSLPQHILDSIQSELDSDGMYSVIYVADTGSKNPNTVIRSLLSSKLVSLRYVTDSEGNIAPQIVVQSNFDDYAQNDEEIAALPYAERIHRYHNELRHASLLAAFDTFLDTEEGDQILDEFALTNGYNKNDEKSLNRFRTTKTLAAFDASMKWLGLDPRNPNSDIQTVLAALFTRVREGADIKELARIGGFNVEILKSLTYLTLAAPPR